MKSQGIRCSLLGVHLLAELGVHLLLKASSSPASRRLGRALGEWAVFLAARAGRYAIAQVTVAALHPRSDTSDKAHGVACGKVVVSCGSTCTTGDLEMAQTIPGRLERGPGGAALSAWLPELAQFLAELLSRCGPVGLDRVAQLRDMTLDVHFVLLQPGNV